MIVLNVTYKCKTDMREKFLERIILEGLDDASRAEEGNMKYDYYIPTDGSNDLLLVEKWRDDGALLQVEATLNLEREAHKGIVIGQGGRMIKALRRQAAKKISELCQHPKVDLKLFVKVVPNWRRRRQFLKDMKVCE